MSSLPFSENTAMFSRDASSAPITSSSSVSASASAPVIISIDGNIGSGKSTKVRDLEKYYTEQGRNDVIFIQLSTRMV